MKKDVKSTMTYVTLVIFLCLSFKGSLETDFIQEIIKLVFVFFLGAQSKSKEGE